eukprot:449555-Pyramimonas_sp.AAC.1
MEEMTKTCSEVEMRAMFDITDSESESDTPNLAKEMREERSNVEPVNVGQDMFGYIILLPRLPPAVVANLQDRKDQWTRHGQSLKRWHFVPRHVTFIRANTDCPVESDRLDVKRPFFCHQHPTWLDCRPRG